MTITCCCFFSALVLMQILLQGIGQSDLGESVCTVSFYFIMHFVYHTQGLVPIL